MRKSQVNPAIIEDLFRSAPNAAQKGQAQYFTPDAFARELATALPSCRPTVVDLSCGDGALLRAVANETTEHTFGLDIDPSVLPKTLKPRAKNPSSVAADLTTAYPLLVEVAWKADLFALNPPWDLHWYREKLTDLADSHLSAVAHAFNAHDGRTSRDTIDSTVATLMIALDRCTARGEGFLIANESTLQRLILGEGAPHGALARHIWGHLVVDGNPCTSSTKVGMTSTSSLKSSAPEASPSTFKTGVIFFAPAHEEGPRELDRARLRDLRYYRNGAELQARFHTDIKPIALRWSAVAQEVEARRQPAPAWNIQLGHDGIIYTSLSLFEQSSAKVDKEEAKLLHSLNGQRPLQLVVQRQQRRALEHAVNGGIWKVQPALQTAVQAAVQQYLQQRAPLQPLSDVQRLGYLDEEDYIVCRKNLSLPVQHPEGRAPASPIISPPPIFLSGLKYQLSTETVTVRRFESKLNLYGIPEDVEYSGQELAIYVTDEYGAKRTFMDAKLRDSSVEVGTHSTASVNSSPNPIAFDFTLQEILDHFDIPEVPDVSAANPDGYARHLEMLSEIERLAGMKCKLFQKTDLACLALHDGAVLGWQQGLGKTLGMFLFAALKCGFAHPNSVGQSCRSALTSSAPEASAPTPFQLQPLGPVLIVAPEDLHDQIRKAGRHLFGATVTHIDSQRTFSRLAPRNCPDGRPALPPGYYITSYTQLTLNGVPKMPDLETANPLEVMDQFCLKLDGEDSPTALFNHRGKVWRVEYLELQLDASATLPQLEAAYNREYAKLDKWTDQNAAGQRAKVLRHAYSTLLNLVTEQENPAFTDLSFSQQMFVVRSFLQHKLAEYEANTGTFRKYTFPTGGTRSASLTSAPEPKPQNLEPSQIRCVGYPSLADLSWNAFDCVMADEGTRTKGQDTIIGTGLRSMQPAYRLILTGTPIKNRLSDIFHLISWAVAANQFGHARWPYTTDEDQQQEFAETFHVSERNLTKEEEMKKRFRKLSPEICNLHRLWKLIAPCVLRRRKSDIGEDIVKLIPHSVFVPMGKYQYQTYQTHLHAPYKDRLGFPAIGTKLQALRMVATAPSCPSLNAPRRHPTEGNKEGTPYLTRSPYSLTPKISAVLGLIEQILARKEQVIIFSAFNEPLDVLSAYLDQAKVAHRKLDGRISPTHRGKAAGLFKLGHPRHSNSRATYPVMLAGAESMAEGHDFPFCNNVIIFCESWALDKTLQAIERAWRLNSYADVNLYNILCDLTIDKDIASMRRDKADSSDLALDGKLITQRPAEVNIAELLNLAHQEFEGTEAQTVDETLLLQEWPALRQRLEKHMARWFELPAQETISPIGLGTHTSRPAPIQREQLSPEQAHIAQWRHRLLSRRAVIGHQKIQSDTRFPD